MRQKLVALLPRQRNLLVRIVTESENAKGLQIPGLDETQRADADVLFVLALVRTFTDSRGTAWYQPTVIGRELATLCRLSVAN